MSASETVSERPAGRPLRAVLIATVLVTVLGLLFGVPAWTVLGAHWPGAVTAAGAVVFAVALLALPALMILGHGPRHLDAAARVGDTLLGVVWVLFAWSVIGNLARGVLALAGVDNPARARIVAVGVLAVSVVLVLWGYAEAMRIPRVRRVDVVLPRLGAGLDGTKVVLLTDTHYGPIDRARWSARVTEVVNSLEPDIVCHTGDIADGSPDQRREQAAPLGDIEAGLARVYVTGNHEYFGDAQGWLDHMRELGWEALHNRHVLVSRGGSTLVVAGVDDYTAAGSGTGHRQDHAAALADVATDLPVLLLAHQPKQVGRAVEAGVDLQLSGHTHGGQIWPFHYLVRVDQPAVQGLSRHGERTQLYTSRGTGFWGPPLRVFAPSEITLLTLRAA
jgi:predicted MPP superfamily phosphohydrolase